MELQGKVIQILPLQTGMGKKGQWRKQQFVLETQTQYPKKVCLTAWGDKIVNLAIGAMVAVSVDLESREYNGRWYTEARAYKIERRPTTLQQRLRHRSPAECLRAQKTICHSKNN